MEINIVFFLIITFVLSSIFRTAFWLKIPIGCLLLVMGALSHDIYQNKGLIVFIIVFAMPYVLPNKSAAFNFIANFIHRRQNKPVKLDFKNPSLSDIKVSDNGYTLSDKSYSINEITVDKKHGYFSSVGVEILLTAYVQKSLFITPLLFFSVAFINEYIVENAIREYIQYFTENKSPYALLFVFICGLIFAIDVLTVLTRQEFENLVDEANNNAIEKRKKILEAEANEALEKRIAEQSLKAEQDKKEKTIEEERKMALELKIQKERTKQKEAESSVELKKLDIERPEKEKNISNLLKKLDDL